MCFFWPPINSATQNRSDGRCRRVVCLRGFFAVAVPPYLRWDVWQFGHCCLKRSLQKQCVPFSDSRACLTEGSWNYSRITRIRKSADDFCWFPQCLICTAAHGVRPLTVSDLPVWLPATDSCHATAELCFLNAQNYSSWKCCDASSLFFMCIFGLLRCPLLMNHRRVRHRRTPGGSYYLMFLSIDCENHPIEHVEDWIISDKTWLGGWCLHLFSMFQSAIRMILVDDFFGSATALRKGGRTGARTARQPHGCISWAAFKTAILRRDSRARLNWFMLAKAKNDIAMDCFFVCCFLVFQPGFMALVAFVAFVFSAP